MILDQQEGLTDVVFDQLSSMVPAKWNHTPFTSALVRDIVEDGEGAQLDLRKARAQLCSIWLSGSKQDTLYSGLDAQGLCTISAQLSGGRLCVRVLADELLSVYGKSSLKDAISDLEATPVGSLPDSFTCPSLSMEYLRTGDICYVPAGYVAVEKSINSEASIAVRTWAPFPKSQETLYLLVVA